MATQNKPRKQRAKLDADALAYRRVLKETFPTTGKIRAPEGAAFIGIGISTWWQYVALGLIAKPTKYGARVSVWDAEYVRGLAVHGIPPKQHAAA